MWLPAFAMKLATDLLCFCTRKTTPLLSIVGDLVSQLESDAGFDYTAAPSGYPLTAITVGMALSSFDILQESAFGALFHHLCDDKSAVAWISRAQRLRRMHSKIHKNRGKYCPDCIAEWMLSPAFTPAPASRSGQRKQRGISRKRTNTLHMKTMLLWLMFCRLDPS